MSQQYWQMKANIDQHNTIQRPLATVFKREYSCCHLVSNLKVCTLSVARTLMKRSLKA